MPGHEVPAEAIGQAQCGLQIHRIADVQRTERGQRQRFHRDVERVDCALARDDSQLWTSAGVNVKLDDHWRIGQELTGRLSDNRNGLYEIESVTMLGYKVSKTATLSGGYVFNPLYSSGVLLALTSGRMAADAVIEGLAKGDTSASQLGKWEAEFARGMDRMRRLVVEFYDGLSFGRFVRKHPHLKDRVTDVLIGDLFKDDVDVLWPLIDEMRAEQAAAKAAKA